MGSKCAMQLAISTALHCAVCQVHRPVVHQPTHWPRFSASAAVSLHPTAIQRFAE